MCRIVDVLSFTLSTSQEWEQTTPTVFPCAWISMTSSCLLSPTLNCMRDISSSFYSLLPCRTLVALSLRCVCLRNIVYRYFRLRLRVIRILPLLQVGKEVLKTSLDLRKTHWSEATEQSSGGKVLWKCLCLQRRTCQDTLERLSEKKSLYRSLCLRKAHISLEAHISDTHWHDSMGAPIESWTARDKKSWQAKHHHAGSFLRRRRPDDVVLR